MPRRPDQFKAIRPAGVSLLAADQGREGPERRMLARKMASGLEETAMAKNVGIVDQWLRIVLGVALIAVIFLIDGPWRWLGLIGIIPLATAFLRWCPLYTLLGIDTCPRQKTQA